MANCPPLFSEIGRRAIDLLTKDYNYGQKFSFLFPTSTGMGFITANGIKMGQIFTADISTQYRIGKTIVDVRVDDTFSNIYSRLTYYDVVPGTRAAISFSVPDHKSGKLYLMYLHRYAAIHSSIGLNAHPRLEVSAAIGSKGVAIGGEIAFDTSSSSFTKCNAGIGFNSPDFSAAITLTDKGQTVKASYARLVNPVTGTEVAATMTHRLSSSRKSFSIGSVHKLDSKTLMKTRFFSKGKVGVLCQREWSPKSLVTVSAEFDTKAITKAPTFGLSIALKP